ncbi:42402_t:CDS:2, partial [Gigaspora margarita]
MKTINLQLILFLVKQIPIYKNKNALESDIPGNSSGSDESNNVSAKDTQSNSDAYQEIGTLDKEIFDFLDQVHKKNIGNRIRERNREKKLQDQEVLPDVKAFSDHKVPQE